MLPILEDPILALTFGSGSIHDWPVLLYSRLPLGQVSLGRYDTQHDHSAGRLWVVTGSKTFLDMGQKGLRGT